MVRAVVKSIYGEGTGKVRIVRKPMLTTGKKQCVIFAQSKHLYTTECAYYYWTLTLVLLNLTNNEQCNFSRKNDSSTATSDCFSRSCTQVVSIKRRLEHSFVKLKEDLKVLLVSEVQYKDSSKRSPVYLNVSCFVFLYFSNPANFCFLWPCPNIHTEPKVFFKMPTCMTLRKCALRAVSAQGSDLHHFC